MAILKDIEVRIARNTSGEVVAESAGDALQEYERPTANINGSSNSIEKYIEAVAGQAFQIEVYIRPTFNMYAASDMMVHLTIDDETVRFKSPTGKNSILWKKMVGKPIIISSVPRFEGTRHYKTGFTFGSLNLGQCRQSGSCRCLANLATRRENRRG